MKLEIRSKRTSQAKAHLWPAALAFLLVAATSCGGNTESPPELSPTPTDSASGDLAPTPTATSGPVSDGSSSPDVGNKVGLRAPEFTLTFSDAEPVTLASLREQGKPVVLYFFTTW